MMDAERVTQALQEFKSFVLDYHQFCSYHVRTMTRTDDEMEAVEADLMSLTTTYLFLEQKYTSIQDNFQNEEDFSDFQSSVSGMKDLRTEILENHGRKMSVPETTIWNHLESSMW